MAASAPATLTLHHGDCLELMKTLPDKSIDLFVCDLPYGCLTSPRASVGPGWRKEVERGEQKTLHRAEKSECAWDIPIDLAAFWVEVKRLCKNDHTPVLMFCTTKFGFELIKSNEDWFRYDLVWSKTKAVGFLHANKAPMRSHEMIYVFSKKGANYTRIDYVGDFPGYVGSHSSAKVYDLPKPDKEGYKKVEGGKRCPTSVVQVKTLTNKGGKHPTQKPDDLYEWLITRYSKEGDTILDPTAGSFASCFTAQRLGRNAIGIEKDDGFYEKAAAKTNSSGS
jgi:site-specific DNA-methyltransferase (adenine-specific)